MKYRDIQLLSFEECSEKLQEEVDYLVQLRFAHAVSPIEHPMKIRETRKIIARLKTAQAVIALRVIAVLKQCRQPSEMQ